MGIAPGYIKTELLAGVSEDVMKSIVAQVPDGRLGEADEIARCVVFLAADESSWIYWLDPDHQRRTVHELGRIAPSNGPECPPLRSQGAQARADHGPIRVDLRSTGAQAGTARRAA
jgi:hypothetical protein